ncbi:MAG: hypothetical protein HYY35_08025 [Deltaproteobacteria bacterium]|nr:hypothetical protein [Deltaproteobacteria bacterium]
MKPKVLLAIPIAVAVVACESRPPATSGGSAATSIRVSRVAEVPLDDVDAAAWRSAATAEIPLMAQGVAYPMLDRASVAKLAVQAMADARWLGIRLQWSDPARDDDTQVDRYTDGVAVEVPLRDVPAANPMMGSKDNPVYLAHWKAVWQHDVEEGHRDVQDRYPGFWADHYPFASGGEPFPVSEAFQTSDARRYFPATTAGNPVSKLERRWPVEELHAEGFGSLADHRFQDARARGRWRDGVWTVVLLLPRAVADPANPSFPDGAKRQMAFALWEGGAGNVAGRKHWHPFVEVGLP